VLIRFSCVVDKAPHFAREALKWHQSLVQLAGVPTDDILVHHTPDVSSESLDAFARAGVNTALIEPVSAERPHMNKVAQCGSAFLRAADLAVLCDCDTVFVSDPRPYLVAGRVAAAVVDRAHPPIEIWDRILPLAGLSRLLPDIQVGSTPEPTIHENRNGGLYVLPGSVLADLEPCWRKWGDWLGTQQQVLGDFVGFGDQMAFALACIELRIDPLLLDRRLNFSTQLGRRTVVDAAPVMLHYHRNVDGAGNLTHVGTPTVDAAIDYVNDRLARPALVRPRQKLLLHVGLPKTATSAMQMWCNTNALQLKEQGIVYPEPSAETSMPKHQFMVTDIMRNEFSATRKALAQGSGGRQVVMTSEGLTNHLYDFRPAALAQFREILRDHAVTVFIVVRDRERWARSYYKQCALNPEVPPYDYASSKSLAEFSSTHRVQRLLNHENLAEDSRAAFGADDVVVANYEDDWKDEFLHRIGYVGGANVAFPDVNTSPPDWLVDVVVKLNGLQLGANARAAYLGAIHRYFDSGHVGLANYAVRAETGNLWGLMDPDIVARLLPEDARWAGFDVFVRKLARG